ncbi:hypothetical protein D3C80_1622660 [compost metagenome]
MINHHAFGGGRVLGNVFHAGTFQTGLGELGQRRSENTLFQPDRVIFAFSRGEIIIVQNISHLSWRNTG